MIGVVDLTNIEIATDEDKRYHIDEWAQLFKAKTWEEIKMLAAKNADIAYAAETIYKLSEDDRIRLQCEAREDYYKRQSVHAEREAKYKAQIAEQEEQIADLKEQLTTQSEQIAELKAMLETIKAGGWS